MATHSKKREGKLVVSLKSQANRETQWDLVLEKISHRKLNEITAKEQLHKIKKKVIRNKQLGFGARLHKFQEPSEIEGGGFLYRTKIRLTLHSYLPKEKLDDRFEKACAVACRAATSVGWQVTQELDGSGAVVENPIIEEISKNFKVPAPAEVKEPRKPLLVPPLDPSVYKDYFSGIYERTAQIRLLHDSIQTFNTTKKDKRGHTLLYGPPATAKTSIFLAFKDWLETCSTRRNSFLMIDATTCTKAGLERELLDRAQANELPDIIVCEEIEKHQTENLLCLLSVMDGRGVISRMNARTGNVQEICKVLVFATCNDYDKLAEFHKGALISRFVHQYECPKPSAELIERILKREVATMGGNQSWVPAALSIAHDVEVGDIRAIIGLLDGRDRLLDGSYRADLMSVYKPKIQGVV